MSTKTYDCYVVSKTIPFALILNVDEEFNFSTLTLQEDQLGIIAPKFSKYLKENNAEISSPILCYTDLDFQFWVNFMDALFWIRNEVNVFSLPLKDEYFIQPRVRDIDTIALLAR